jgi:hypothetical protein
MFALAVPVAYALFPRLITDEMGRPAPPEASHPHVTRLLDPR